MRKRMLELERVRFAIEVLRDAGASGRDIEKVYLGTHSQNCACWQCVFELRNAVILHRASLVARANWQRLHSQVNLTAKSEACESGAQSSRR